MGYFRGPAARVDGSGYGSGCLRVLAPGLAPGSGVVSSAFVLQGLQHESDVALPPTIQRCCAVTVDDAVVRWDLSV